MIPSALRRAALALALLFVPSVASAQFTIQRTSSPIFYNDVGNTPSLQCMYASYEVTNTSGSTIQDVWVDANSFTGGVVTLAPSEDGVVELGTMAPGQKKTAYFYLKASSTTASAQHHVVHVYASRPPVAPALTQSFSITSVQSTINSNANKVTTVVSGPNPPQVGGIVTITVTGQTGTVGAPPVLAFSPAADLSWSAGVFEMISTQITLSGSPNAGVITDSLIFAPGDPSNTSYVAVYTLRAAGSTAAPTFVSPIGYFASGAQVKHTDTGNYGGFTPIAAPQSQLTLTKSATPTYLIDGGISTYTIHLLNAGFAAATLDDIKDVLPGASTIVPGTSTLDGSPIADPTVFGQNAFWYGPITMPPNTARDLVYQVSFPATAGIFVNQALSHVGIALIDTTLAVTDSVPAQVPVEVYVHNADLSITKADAPDPVGPDSLLTYTMVVRHSGPDSSFATTVVDTLPAGVNYVNATTSLGGISESGGVVTALLGTMVTGDSATIVITVIPTAVGTLTNRAHVAGTRVDYVPANNTATAVTTVAVPPSADLQLVKRASPSTFTVGQLIDYELTATNVGTGPSQLTTTVVDTLPAGMTYVGGSGPGWSVSESGGVVTASYAGAIAVGDSAKVTIQAIATVAAFPGVRNFATASTYHDGTAENDTSSVFNSVVSAPDLALSKHHAGTFVVGSPGQYVITASNVGNLPALSTITVVDTLPSGLSYTGSSGAGWTINESSGIVTATYPGPLAAGDSVSFSIDVAVSAAAVPGVVNTAVAQTAGDVGALNDRAVDPTVVTGFPDIQMIKRATTPTFTEGGLATWTLTVTNLGTDVNTSPITITDTLAPGLTYLNAVGAGFTVGFVDPVVTATYAGALAPGDSAVVTLTARTSGASLPVVSNLAVANTSGDTSAGNDSSSTATNVVGAPDLRIAKAHAGDFTVGQPGQYVIKVWNDGSVDPGSFTVSDTLPSGLTFVTGSGAGWNVASTPFEVTATRASGLAPGDSASFTIDVTVAPAAQPFVVNAAVVAATGDVDPTNDRATDPTNVGGPLAPDLQVVLRAPTAPFTVGGLGQYTIAITNVGNAPTTGTIAATDSLPPGVAFLAGLAAGYTVVGPGNVVTATGNNVLAPGDSVVVTVDGRVSAAAFPSIFNLVHITTPGDTNPANDASSLVVTVGSAPDLRIEKTHAADFTVGANGQYRIAVFNDGTQATGSVTVADTLPAGLSFVSGAGAGWVINESLGIVTASNAGPIAAGDSASFTLDVLAAAAAQPSVTNVASVQTAGDLNATNDVASDPTNVLPPSGAPNLRVTKTHGADFTVGANGQYRIAVFNDGNLPTTGTVTVTDTLPSGLSFIAGNGPGWAVNESLGIVTATNANPIAAGDSASFTLDVAVGAAAFPSVTNSAVAQAAGDTDPSNDRSDDPTTVNAAPAPDLQLVKRAPGAPFTAGSTATYVLAVTNIGTGPTTGAIAVSDTLPAGLTFVSGTGTGWIVNEAAGIVTATNAGPLAAGDSASVSIDVLVGAAAVPSVTNSASLTTPGDTDPSNDRSSNTSAVNGAPDLQLVKEHFNPFVVNQNGAWTLTVKNVGSSPTSGTITVVDSLPTGATFVSGNGAGWAFAPSGQVVTATHAGPIAAGDSLQFTLTASIDAAALPSVTNVAVASTVGDPNAANDRATDLTPIGGVPDVVLYKTHVGTFTVGQVATYKLAVYNVGTAATTGAITVTDTLQAGLTFVSLTGSGWVGAAAGGIVTANYLTPVAPGDSAVVLLNVFVGPAAYPSVSNSAVAQTIGDPTPGRGSDVPAPVAFNAQLVLEKSAAPGVVEPADVVTYTLVLRNTGVSNVPTVTVRDTLPVGFKYADGTATLNGSPIGDPAGAPGAGLAFAIANVPGNSTSVLRYRALVGTSAVLGDGVNRAFAENALLNIRSNVAAAKVEIRGGVFADDGIIAGKVYADCDCDSNRTQAKGELGVPGVRVYLEDGRSSVTDVEGKYHFEAVDPRLHTVKLDRSTLPAGARPLAIDSRDAGGAGSRFADVKDGELFRADFALGGCDNAMVAELKARRELGEVRAAIETGQPTSAANVLPGATRVIDGPAWEGAAAPQSDGGAFFHLEPRGSLNAANSNVPDAPGTPGILAGAPPVAPPGLSISVPRRPAPADGKTLVPVTVHVPGDRPTRVTLDTDLGLWQVADQDPKIDGVQTTVTTQATFVLVAPPVPGRSIVRVTELTAWGDTLAHDVRPVHEVEADLAFIPAHRPWLIAGTLEGRYETRSVHDDELAPGQLRDRFEDAFATILHVNDDGTAIYGGRGAMFARGSIGRDAEVTFRYDSEHAHDRRRFEDIRPGEGDDLFGDASIQGFEAQSTERLYARIDKGASYALYGDFMTDGLDPIRRLGAYTRGINGARAHAEGGKLALDAWGSHDRDRQVIDEIPGEGVSGPYPLSRKDGVLNSEKVEVVTRDRNNPSVILERKTLVRFADYTIEPFTGRLLFRAPVASVDERLNPVSIRVTYEVEGGGDRFWTAGGSAHLKPVDRIELMGNYVKEDDPFEAHEQFGAGTTVRLLDKTYVTGEWAHSDSAGTLTAEAYRGEIRVSAEKLDLRAFGLRTDPGFNNPSSGYVAGREEWGGDARYALGGRTVISAEAVRTRDVVTDGRRKGASLAIDHRLSKSLSLGVGYRWARESTVPAGGGPAVPTPNDVDAARARLALQLGMRTSAFAEYEKSVGVGDAKRFAIGGDVRATDHVRAYARHEFINSLAGPYAMNGQQEQNTTVFGFAADGYEDLTAFSEYRIRDAFAGREAEAAVGLRDRWRLSPSVRVLLSMERVAQQSGSGVTALASGLEWTGDPLTKGSARLEFRDATDEQQWLASAGLARKMGRDWTALLRSSWSWAPGHERTVARDEFALALRETDVNHWNMIGRIEHRLDDQALDPLTNNHHEVWLASTRFNVKAAQPLTLVARLAGKWTFDESQGRTLDARGSLASMRALYDLSPRFDLALSARSRFDGGWDHRTDGLGAELGVVLIKNLRLSGGYNAFGFHDVDFASMERTDKGPFVAFGFKFDESLFGGSGQNAPVPAEPGISAQRGAIVTPPRDTLEVRSQRLSDEAIATDLRTIDGWRARVDALPDSVGIYGRAKARAWLDLARDAYVSGDRNEEASAALANAIALSRAMAANDTVAFKAAAAHGLPRGGNDPALTSKAAALHESVGYHCAEEEVAKLEVQTAWAAHETRAPGACMAEPHLAEARRLADVAQQKVDDCIKAAAPPPPPPPAPAPPVAPNKEIEEALSGIPSGIHFALNKSVLSPTSKNVVKRIAAVLVKYPDVKVELEGHTDSRGSAEYNLALSKKRAEAVQAGLVAEGVDAMRITTTFAGKANLLNAEKDVTDLALNRRVDFKYYDANGASIKAEKQTGDIQVEKAPVKKARKPATKP